MEIMKMKRFMKIMTIASMSSVYLMQAPCTSTLDHGGGAGMSILPATLSSLIRSFIPFV
jgi:hypothetical protein